MQKKFFILSSFFSLTCGLMWFKLYYIKDEILSIKFLFIIFIYFILEAGVLLQLKCYSSMYYKETNGLIIDNEKISANLAIFLIFVFGISFSSLVNQVNVWFFFIIGILFFINGILGFLTINKLNFTYEKSDNKNFSKIIFKFYIENWRLFSSIIIAKVSFSIWCYYQPIYLNSKTEIIEKNMISSIFCIIFISSIFSMFFVRKIYNIISPKNLLSISIFGIILSIFLGLHFKNILVIIVSYILLGLSSGIAILATQHLFFKITNNCLVVAKLSYWSIIEDTIVAISLFLMGVLIKNITINWIILICILLNILVIALLNFRYKLCEI
ncbi:hypothetical protein [Silvanigrella aquatica]|uniref:hypothetical protein n=1 Tax=Silvanigrella aquatica TaxID=1915309 RepID=UPI0011E60162|nr:hypothetical protein [Silvanigrella aquatica]